MVIERWAIFCDALIKPCFLTEFGFGVRRGGEGVMKLTFMGFREWPRA